MTYTVKPGDSLSKIAGAMYGNEMLYPIIAKANNITNVNYIYPGQVLTIPTNSSAPAASPSSGPDFSIPASKIAPGATQIPPQSLVKQTASSTPGQSPGTSATVAPKKPMSASDKLMLSAGIALALGALAAVVMRKKKTVKAAKA